MKTIKDFKDACKVGAKFRFRAHWTNGETVLRTVTHKQSNSVAFTHPTRDGSSWLDWPKAKECIFTDHGLYIVDPALRECFVDALKHGPITKHIDPYLFYSPIQNEEN